MMRVASFHCRLIKAADIGNFKQKTPYRKKSLAKRDVEFSEQSLPP